MVVPGKWLWRNTAALSEALRKGAGHWTFVGLAGDGRGMGGGSWDRSTWISGSSRELAGLRNPGWPWKGGSSAWRLLLDQQAWALP